MKKLVPVAFAFLALAQTALADPIIVVRPQIGSGTAGVLPQTAFSVSPSLPGTPTGPTTPSPSVIFTSIGYEASLPLRTVEQSVHVSREYHINYGISQGFEFCTFVDDAGKTLSSKMKFYTESEVNGHMIVIRPVQSGILRAVISCGTTSATAYPVEKFEIVAK